MVLHPFASADLLDLSPFETAVKGVIDVFQAGVGQLELGSFEASGQRPVFFPGPLAFDQQGQAFLKLQFEYVGLPALFFQGLGHAVQAQGA